MECTLQDSIKQITRLESDNVISHHKNTEGEQEVAMSASEESNNWLVKANEIFLTSV